MEVAWNVMFLDKLVNFLEDESFIGNDLERLLRAMVFRVMSEASESIFERSARDYM